ncbi:MAG TPA: hypothetical protein VKA09_18515 [Nitrososphaeraceae archaeon]|nr:hypothetical protein [Nitrososphaeraceae archaeon]
MDRSLKGWLAISTPNYFLFDAPLTKNATTLAETSSTEAQPAQTGNNNIIMTVYQQSA